MNPEQVIAQMRQQGATEADIEAYLRSAGAEEIKPSQTQRNVRTALKMPGGRAMLGRQNAAELQSDLPSVGDYLRSVPEAFETVAAGMPGAKLAISGARALETGRPLADVQQEVNQETSDIPYASAIGRAAGTLATAPFLPASGAASGAILMGADQALNNDPGSALGNRVVRGLAGAGIGGLAGAATDRIVTGGRAWLAGNAAKTRLQMLADRAASARDLYGQAIAEGQNKATPKAVADFLAEPDIADIVTKLQGTRPYANVRPDSPEMLDAIYKNLSDQAGALKGKLGALTPRGANLGRVAQQDVGQAQDALLNAVETPSGATFPGDPGRDALMPNYRNAVEDFANRSRGINSFDTGYDAMRSAISPSAPSAKNLTRPNKTPQALADWVESLQTNADDANNAAQGILGMAKTQPGGIRLSNMGKAAKLLRSMDAVTGNVTPNLTQKSLLGLLAALSNP